MIFRALSNVSRSAAARSLLLSVPKKVQSPGGINQLHTLILGSPIKARSKDVSMIHYSTLNPSIFQRFGISSSASPEPSDKEHGNAEGQENVELSKDAKVSDEVKDGDSTETEAKVSDSESDEELSKDDLIKLVVERDDLLKLKQKEIEQMKDKVVRTLAEMENVMARTRRDAENSKKFAVQNFAKSLLDVADNLGRASSHVKGSFSKIDESQGDAGGALPLLKTLLEGVEMTEKQLLEVFRKSGIEKFDPTNEPFDPNRHNAVFQVPDNSKPAGTIAHVLKAGYMLHDRVIRPAEVGVTQQSEDGGEKGSEA